MPTEFFEKYPTSLRLEMFTVMNKGFQRWDPVPISAEAKVFLVITAEDLSDGAFTTQIVGLSLNGLKDMGKNGCQGLAGLPEMLQHGHAQDHVKRLIRQGRQDARKLPFDRGDIAQRLEIIGQRDVHQRRRPD